MSLLSSGLCEQQNKCKAIRFVLWDGYGLSARQVGLRASGHGSPNFSVFCLKQGGNVCKRAQLAFIALSQRTFPP